MPRPHPDVAVALAALLGVAALHVGGALLAPPVVALADAPSHEGARIAVDGARVLAVAHGKHGRALTLAQDGARLTALASPGAGPERGDVVRAVGIVTRLADGPGLSLDTLVLLEAAASRPLWPADVARSPQDFEGARVLLRGEAREGALVGGGARVRLAGEAVPTPSAGMWLVAGSIYYRTSDAAFVLGAETWSPSS